MIKVFLNIIDKVYTDFREHIVKTSIVILLLATVYLLTENIFLSFLAGSVAAVLLLNWDSRIFIGVGLIFLISTPLILAFGKRAAAGQMAVYAYYMLALGVVLQIVHHCKALLLEEKKPKRRTRSKKVEPMAVAAAPPARAGINKKRAVFVSAIFLILLIPLGYSSRFFYKKVKNELYKKILSIGTVILEPIEGQMAERLPAELSGEEIVFKEADKETVKVLIENSSGRDGLGEKVAEKFRGLGVLNVYTAKVANTLSTNTTVRFCSGCSGVAIELLSVLQNSENLSVREETDLTDEIAITLGQDQAVITNSDIDISVLNGSKTAGAARALGADLAKEGFKIINVSDAGRKDYQQTIIKYSPGNIKKANIIQEYLANFYRNLEMFEDSSLLADAEIIIGQK